MDILGGLVDAVVGGSWLVSSLSQILGQSLATVPRSPNPPARSLGLRLSSTLFLENRPPRSWSSPIFPNTSLRRVSLSHLTDGETLLRGEINHPRSQI